MIDVQAVRTREFPVLRQAYAEKDAILYALALGYGSDSVDEEQLCFVLEPALRVVPAFANVLGHPGFWISDPATGVDAAKAVHGEHRMRFHAPLPPRGKVRAQTRVVDVLDKGAGKGALVVTERLVHDDTSGALLATIEQHTLCRGDGGFSGAPPERSAPKVEAPAERAPDHVVDIPVLPQAALLYRQSADLNPLHADPRVARAAGFARPILHGLCTFGIACRALLQACAGNEPARLRGLAGRFSAPVYPGETLRTEIWREGARDIRLRCSVPERASVVFSNGVASLAA